MEYIVLMILVSVCMFADIFIDDEKQKIKIYVCLMIFMIIFTGIRYETGNDWKEYTDVFKKVPTISELIQGNYEEYQLRMEKGYLATNVIIKSLGGSINEVFLLMSFLTVGLIFLCCKQYTPLAFLAIGLYLRYGYLQANMMFVRQGFSVAVFLYSLKYIYNKNFFNYMLCMLICIIFHKSSLVLIPVYFIAGRKYSLKVVIIAIVGCILLAMFDWIKVITYVTPDSIDFHINSYLNNASWGGKSVVSIALIEKLFILTIGLKFRDKLEQKSKYFNIFFNIYLLSFMVYYAFLQQYVFQQRISLFFNISGIILITYYVMLIKSNKIKLITYLVIIMIINVFTLKAIGFFSDNSAYLPYKSYIPMYIENFIDSIINS